jgi:hypothetical protein
MTGRPLIASLLLLGGCAQAPAQPADPRPDWSGYAIDGITPLMSLEQVTAALKTHGYSRVKCPVPLSDTGTGPGLLPVGPATGCYRTPSRAWSLQIKFIALPEGRRLSDVVFHDIGGRDMTADERRARNASFADELSKRFGKPSLVQDQGIFSKLYWVVPGSSPDVEDYAATTVAAREGANVMMISNWAYERELRTGQ